VLWKQVALIFWKKILWVLFEIMRLRLCKLHIIEMRKECWDECRGLERMTAGDGYCLIIKATAIRTPYNLLSYKWGLLCFLSFLSEWTRKPQNNQLLWSSATKESVNPLVSQDWDILEQLLRQEETFRQAQQGSSVTEIAEAACFCSCGSCRCMLLLS